MVWSWLSPPGVPMAISGSPSLNTMLGVRVYRGRARGRIWLARSGSSQNCSPRVLSPMPVPPRMTPPPVQPPLGVASKTLPSSSMTAMCVVSFRPPADGTNDPSASLAATPSAMSATQNGHSPTVGSCGSGSPARNATDARPGIDLGRPLAGVGGGQQALGRHVDEVGIGVVGVAVGVGQLHRLDDGVEVVGAVVAHRLQVELLQDVERLQQHRALAVEPVLVDGVVAVVSAGGRLDPRVELGEVVELEGRAVLLQEGDHLLGDVALVEAIPGGGDALRAAQMRAGPFRLDHHSRESGGEGRER